MRISYTAAGGGYFRVLVDGVEASKHSQEREALEAATALEEQDPARDVEVTHDGYRVKVKEGDLGLELRHGDRLQLVSDHPNVVFLGELTVQAEGDPATVQLRLVKV